jgi:hypothetical protein
MQQVPSFPSFSNVGLTRINSYPNASINSANDESKSNDEKNSSYGFIAMPDDPHLEESLLPAQSRGSSLKESLLKCCPTPPNRAKLTTALFGVGSVALLIGTTLGSYALINETTEAKVRHMGLNPKNATIHGDEECFQYLNNATQTECFSRIDDFHAIVGTVAVLLVGCGVTAVCCIKTLSKSVQTFCGHS